MLDHVRKLFGYTQSELAAKVGITQNYYTQIETGSSKSAHVIAKISKELRIKESFLISVGEYTEYPFLGNFYIFYLPERRAIQGYKFLLDYICSPSKFVDVVFFFIRPPSHRMPLYSFTVYIAFRDDHDTVFLLKRQNKTTTFSVARKTKDAKPYQKENVRYKMFSLIDIFREELHKLRTTYVYEKTVRIGDDFLDAIEKGVISRGDVLAYFPTEEYISGLCKSRGKN